MKTKFYAHDVPILNLSHKPDSVGLIIPPEALVRFPASLIVTYGEESVESTVGTAALKKIGDRIFADMALLSSWTNKAQSEAEIRKLYPAVSFIVREAVGAAVFSLDIYELFLTPYGNEDLTIEPLGLRLVRIGALKQ